MLIFRFTVRSTMGRASRELPALQPIGDITYYILPYPDSHPQAVHPVSAEAVPLDVPFLRNLHQCGTVVQSHRRRPAKA